MFDSFVFYKSFYDAAAVLQPEDRLAFYDALAEYAICGEDPEPATPVAKAMFLMAKPQIDANVKRREDGKKGGRPSKEKPVVSENAVNEKPVVSENDESEKPNVNANANANVNGNANEKKKRVVRSAPPTFEEVTEYCKERANSIDPEAFIAYYESQNWKKANGQPVYDWKGCIRTWEKREKTKPAREPPKPKAAYFDVPQRSYDYAALERQILGGN